MKYKFIHQRGALNEGAAPDFDSVIRKLESYQPPDEVLDLVPESVARENTILPLHDDGETITCVAIDPEDLATLDKLRFILARNIVLLRAPRNRIIAAIDRLYGQREGESADSMLQVFHDAAIDFSETEDRLLDFDTRDCRRKKARGSRLQVIDESTGRLLRNEDLSLFSFKPGCADFVTSPCVPSERGRGMFFYVVDEGQRVLVRKKDGTIDALEGPQRVWRWGKKFELMEQHVAHPGDFLIIRFRNGTQQHVAGPVEMWFDPRIHAEIERQEVMQLGTKEAVVVYSRDGKSNEATRRIVYGPVQFVPEPGEWLHKFSWHASKGGSKGVSKVPHGLVFHKLWLMPDQMYHDVPDVRTADDAVLTIRLMIFFELVDVDRMLDATHDPIGDMINATTADVVEFTGRYDFESFKRNTDQLNQLEAYKQLTHRASQCGYRISNVVYRGYGAPDSLQQMHDQAIEARTRLQLDKATEQQAQELENYKLECQLARAAKRRSEQTGEVQHELELQAQKHEADLQQRGKREEFSRRQKLAAAEITEEMRRRQHELDQAHLNSLREMGVDLTSYLTQNRADRVIELRGGNGVRPHVHLDQATTSIAQSSDS